MSDIVPVAIGLAVGIGFLVMLSLALGVSSSPSNPPPQTVTITLERTACFGFCPVYSLVVYGNGTIHYDGQSWVAVKGKQVSTVQIGEVQKLLEKANEIGYFGLKDEYTQPISDLPTTITSITTEEARKKIVNYAGAPDSLREFEEMIDQVSGSANWVKCSSGELIVDPNGSCR